MRSLTLVIVRSFARQSALSAVLCGLILVWLVAPAPVWAATESFTISKAGTIKEVELKAGRYTMEIKDSNHVIIYRGKDKVGEFEAEVKPLEKAQPMAVTFRKTGSSRFEARSTWLSSSVEIACRVGTKV